MTIDDVATVLFVGAGTMGCANSLMAAVSGYDVVLTDARPDNLDLVSGHHDEIGAFLVAGGYCTDADLAGARLRVTTTADPLEAVRGVDLVSESVFEDLDVKRDVHRRLDETAPPDAILTTNSSSLLVSEIEDAVRRGDRFAALHSHLGSLLFDIVGGPRTSPATIDVLRRYVQSIGGVPLVLRREHPGYVFNAINGPVLATALRLVVEGRADIESVDRAWMTERGAPLGPFAMMDLFGLDVVLHAWLPPSDDPVRQALQAGVEPLLRAHVDQGELGRKSGRGFYAYPDPAYEAPSFTTAEPVDPATAAALTTAWITAAVTVEAADVASAGDIDVAWTVATGQEQGPFTILDTVGDDAFVAMLTAQVDAGVVAPETADPVVAHLTTRASREKR